MRHFEPIEPLETSIPPKIQTTKIERHEREVHQFVQKAEQFLKQQNHKKGLELLDHAYRIDPKNADVLVKIGSVKHELNMGAEADKFLSRALQVNPTHEIAIKLRQETKAIAIRADEKRLAKIDRPCFMYNFVHRGIANTV
jgi:tetratricopeptide (TPR) repeat protein